MVRESIARAIQVSGVESVIKDPAAVGMLRPTIEEDEPGWLEAAKREWKGSWNIESTACWLEVPIQAVVAILLNLSDRSELEFKED